MKSKAREMYGFKSRLGTTASSMPCSSRNSLRWKPCGSFWRIVCSITRGPAKPIAEPGALIGFAGPRVIEQTIRQKLPQGFQRSEFLLEHGMLDAVVHRRHLRPYISRALAFMDRSSAIRD